VRISRDTARGFAGVLLAFAIIALIHFIKPGVTAAPDYPCQKSQKASVVIDIRSGESGSEIAQELFDKGVTASFQSFFRVAVGDSRSGSIAPGLHSIDREICAKDALDQLLDSARIGNLISINEGAWNSEIKAKLRAIGYSKKEVDSAFSSSPRPDGFKSIEGLLFPAQYSFDSATSVSEIVGVMINRGQREMRSAGLFDSSEKFSPYQFLIIASLVQAEGDTQDFAKISQVVRNRLKIGMPLQFDSTVHYIKGSRGSVFLSTQSTLLKSPYNSYRNYGLPPGPINNPGSKAMYAAVHPEKGAWLYFITVAPGDTRFTDSIDEFNNWKVLYKKNLRDGKFGSKK
jgi:UPF0755 protein